LEELGLHLERVLHVLGLNELVPEVERRGDVALQNCLAWSAMGGGA